MLTYLLEASGGLSNLGIVLVLFVFLTTLREDISTMEKCSTSDKSIQYYDGPTNVTSHSNISRWDNV